MVTITQLLECSMEVTFREDEDGVWHAEGEGLEGAGRTMAEALAALKEKWRASDSGVLDDMRLLRRRGWTAFNKRP